MASRRKRNPTRRKSRATEAGPRSHAGRAAQAEAAAAAEADPHGHLAEIARLEAALTEAEAALARVRAERDRLNARVGRQIQKQGTTTPAPPPSEPKGIEVADPAELYPGEARGMVLELVEAELKAAASRVDAGTPTRRLRVLGAVVRATRPVPERAAMEHKLKTLLSGYRHNDGGFRKGLVGLPLKLEVRTGSHHKLVCSGDTDVRMTLSGSSSDIKAGSNMHAQFRKVFM